MEHSSSLGQASEHRPQSRAGLSPVEHHGAGEPALVQLESVTPWWVKGNRHGAPSTVVQLIKTE